MNLTYDAKQGLGLRPAIDPSGIALSRQPHEAVAYTQYDCPHCGGKNAFSGNRKRGERFRGSAVCEDCGGSFSAVHAKATGSVFTHPTEQYDELQKKWAPIALSRHISRVYDAAPGLWLARKGDDGGGRWITIGSQEGEDGKKVGGTPVYINGSGTITKGPAGVTGKKPSELGKRPSRPAKYDSEARKWVPIEGDKPNTPNVKPDEPRQPQADPGEVRSRSARDHEERAKSEAKTEEKPKAATPKNWKERQDARREAYKAGKLKAASDAREQRQTKQAASDAFPTDAQVAAIAKDDIDAGMKPDEAYAKATKTWQERRKQAMEATAKGEPKAEPKAEAKPESKQADKSIDSDAVTKAKAVPIGEAVSHAIGHLAFEKFSRTGFVPQADIAEYLAKARPGTTEAEVEAAMVEHWKSGKHDISESDGTYMQKGMYAKAKVPGTAPRHAALLSTGGGNVPDAKTLKASVADVATSLREKHGDFVPIHAVRDAIAKKHGEDAASHENLDEHFASIAGAKLLNVSDTRGFTLDQLNASVKDGSKTLAYVDFSGDRQMTGPKSDPLADIDFGMMDAGTEAPKGTGRDPALQAKMDEAGRAAYAKNSKAANQERQASMTTKAKVVSDIDEEIEKLKAKRKAATIGLSRRYVPGSGWVLEAPQSVRLVYRPLERRWENEPVTAIALSLGCVTPVTGVPMGLSGRATQTDSGEPIHFFWKRVIADSPRYRHPKTGKRFSVTSDDIHGWQKQVKTWAKLGREIPTPVDHSWAARDNLGSVVDAKVDQDGGRTYLSLLHRVVGDDAKKIAERNWASIWIEPNYTDEFGNKWGKAITHSSFVTNPVVSGMGPFTMAA